MILMTSLVLASLCRQDGETTGQVKGGNPTWMPEILKERGWSKGLPTSFWNFL